MRIRNFPESNYRSVYRNGKTIRIALDTKKPITELEYPEFYDVKITSYCTGGCPYCYMDSKSTDSHFPNIVERTLDFFGKMDENQRPFQVAIGGGNPNQHPEFCELLKTYHELGITPNYTTNGIGLTSEVMEATKKYSGGVAVTSHKHLDKVWRVAVNKLHAAGIRTNLHVVISDDASVEDFVSIYESFVDKVDYFVLLPMLEMGRATNVGRLSFEYLRKVIIKKMDADKIAFGANFYPYLKAIDDFGISMYEPEIMSKYLDMEDMSIHKSSFHLNGKA